MARQKRVFDTGEVAHVWARQTQSEGRNPQGNFYFTGDTIYSYGGHFPIARIVTRKKRTCVLFTTRTYSNTTNTHLSLTCQAVRHLDIFNIGPRISPEPSVSHDLDDYRRRVADLLDKAGRARSNGPGYVASARRLVEEANRCAAFFGIRARLSMPANLDEVFAAARARAAAEAKRNREANAERAAAEAAYAATLEEWKGRAIAEWIAGRPVPPLRHNGESRNPVIRWIDPAYLRIDPAEPDQVETSAGARVPLAVVERAYRRLAVGVDLGGYTVSSVTDTEVRVGCHTFARSEVDRFARSQGWAMPEPAAPTNA